ARGWRTGRAAAWAGGLMRVKPILTIRAGEVVPLKRVRGNQRAFHEFITAFESGSVDGPGLRVAIADADSHDRSEALKELVQRTRPQAQLELVTTLGPVIGTHAGPGTGGAFWCGHGSSPGFRRERAARSLAADEGAVAVRGFGVVARHASGCRA